jgi:hypothetical protein
MKRLNYLVVTSILGALIVAMVAIVPASANKPMHDKGFFEGDSIFTGCEFEIPAHFDGHFEYIEWPDYGVLHLLGNQLTLSYNGHTLTLHESINNRADWITFYDARLEIRGADFIGTLPGHGIVTGTAGKQVYLETCDWGPDGDWVCEYELLDFSGMVFDEPGAICNYLLNGK